MDLVDQDDPDDPPMTVVGVSNIDHMPVKLKAQNSVKSIKSVNKVKNSVKSVSKVKNSANSQSTKETPCSSAMSSSDEVLIYKENSSSSTEESDFDKNPLMPDKKTLYKLLKTQSSYLLYQYEEAVFPGILHKKMDLGIHSQSGSCKNTSLIIIV